MKISKLLNKIKKDIEYYLQERTMDDELVVANIEVTQAIQNLNNDAKIIKGKKTYARIYFDLVNSNIVGEYKITGKLKCSQNGKYFEDTFDSQNTISIKNIGIENLKKKRLSWNSSLNFDISAVLKSIDVECDLELELSVIEQEVSNTVLNKGKFYVKNNIFKIENKNLVGSPYLYCTALVFRYWDSVDQRYIEPEPAKVDLIRQYIASAFPVAEGNLKWNTINVSATEDFRALNRVPEYREDLDEVASKELVDLLLQTILHRNQDLNVEGRDIRTLYLGVFDDPSGRLGGAAIDSPEFSAHNIVGVTVIDNNGETGAHELAHMLGRKHPGVPDRQRFGPQIGQRKEDESKEVPKSGFLSEKFGGYLGLHCDPRSSEPKVYEHNLWFDLMTYRFPQWVSKYTYEGLLDRLGDMFSNLVKSIFEAKSPSKWVVIGEYDLHRKSGKILYVLPTSYQTIETRKLNDPDQISHEERSAAFELEKSEIQIQCNYEINGSIESRNIKVYHRTVSDTDMPSFGLFQTTIDTKDLDNIVLKIVDADVDKFSKLEPEFKQKMDKIYETHESSSGFKRNKKIDEFQIENGWQYLLEDVNRYVVFTYSVEDDEYCIKYDWQKIQTQVITTIQCQKSGEDIWETVIVTTRQKGKVWISSNFIEKHYSINNPRDDQFNTPPYSFMSKKSRPVRDRIKDKLIYRVILTAGFKYYKLQIENVEPLVEFPKYKYQNMMEIIDSDGDRATKFDSQLNRSGKYRTLR